MGALIVHEWLEPRGGSERVVDSMLEAFPRAKLVALWNDAPEKYREVRESWLAHTPLRHHKALALPFEPSTWRHVVAPGEFDFVLVSSHLFAHHVDVRSRNGDRVPKYVYAHTPARYIWEPNLDRRGASPAVRTAASTFRPVDRKRAQEAERIAVNSRFVKDRVSRTWRRQSEVIYPPVDVDEIIASNEQSQHFSSRDLATLEQLPDMFLLGASRFVPYKRLDWVVRVGEELGVPVVIAGSGPEEARLRDLSQDVSVPVLIVIGPSTGMLRELYRRAALFIFPAIEDFGIMPVEAQAAGTPVVTTSVGGARETFIDGTSGVAAEADSLLEVAEAAERALRLPDFDPASAVGRFSKQRFMIELQKWLQS